ncbi:MAG TPA: helix-turn-helix domain-containing protein [Gemmatimonadales bacterium]|jgi:DeoR family suf operon transcriptional repressor
MRSSRFHDSSDKATAPSKVRGTRAALLLELKRTGSATAATLAAALECSLNAVRHHLKELEAEGAVLHERTHHGVGAPTHTYRLSQAGHGLFPDRYAGTIAFLLDRLVALEGREVSATVVEDHCNAIAERICATGAAADPEQRGDRIANALDAEGYMATWKRGLDGGVLVEHNCPHQLIADRFPEICRAEEAFLSRAFGGIVTRQSRISAGCGTCTYHVSYGDAAPVGEGS